MRIRSASYVVMALVLLLTAACGGSPTASNTGSAPAGATAAQQVYDQINGLKGSERTNTLLDLAKKDGTLSLYTSNTDMDDVVKAFEDKYGLKVETYRANSETVLQRVLQEASANYQGADLIETNAGELNAMQQRQLLYPYEGELRDKVRPEGRKDGWTADRFNAFVIGLEHQQGPGRHRAAITQGPGRTAMEGPRRPGNRRRRLVRRDVQLLQVSRILRRRGDELLPPAGGEFEDRQGPYGDG